MKVLMVVVPVILGLLIFAAVAIPHMIQKAALHNIPHVGKRTADARVAEALHRTENATNPPLKLHLIGPDNSSSCDMNDGVLGVDGSKFDGLYDVPVTDPAEATTLMRQIMHYWAAQPQTQIVSDAMVIWRPDSQGGEEYSADQLDLTITLSVSPPNKYEPSDTLMVGMVGQCVPNS
jgi:hypothetical protein